MFQELHWQNFPNSVKYQQALLVYKSLNNLAPPYMRDMFQYVEDIGRTNLRSVSNHKLYAPRAHHKSIRSSGPKVWNNLEKEVRTAKSLRQFKQMYHRDN
jgi:hypothetical protein